MNDEHVLDQATAYVLNQLPAEERRAFERAAADSPHVQAILEEVRGLLGDLEQLATPAPAAELIRRAEVLLRKPPEADRSIAQWLDETARVVASLVFDSRRQPSLAGLRGPFEGGHLIFESPRGSVDVHLSPLRAEDPEQWIVRGQLALDEGRRDVDVALVRPGTAESVARSVTDERGHFRLESPSGRFDLLIALDASTLVLQDLDIE
jgi:hypothetical protein